MAKRFLNTTEKSLVLLVKQVMRRHQPPTGFRRAFYNAVRRISTGRKPYNAHGLSLLVTEDMLVEITNLFGTLDTSAAFMNVMALADEEVIEHYTHNGRAPVFVEMLNEAKSQIRKGRLVSKDWGIDTFSSFIKGYFQSHSMRFNAEHLRQAFEILMSPNGYRILSVNWLLIRLISAAYVATAASTDADRELLYKAASTAASMEDTDNGAFASLLVNADVCALKEMLAAEQTSMVNLYGSVLLGPYVNEVQQSVAGEFKRENKFLSAVLNACSAMLVPVGKVSMMFYCGSMIGSIIQQMSGEVPVDNEAFCKTYDAECAANTVPQVLVSNLDSGHDTYKRKQCLAGLQNRFGVDYACPVPNATTWQEVIRHASSESMKMANLSAIPASCSVLVVIYLSMPLISFSEYVAEWIGRRTASRLDRSRFLAPSKFSLYTVTAIIKLVINTFLTMTTHLSNRLFSSVVNWTVTRVYFPLSLIEQPLKTTSFYNIAMSAASSTRHVRIVPSKVKCIAAALIAVPFEYTGHILQNWQMVSGSALSGPAYAAVTATVFVIKTARIAAMFGPILLARYQRKNLPFSSQFEKVFWYDGIRCITAPLVLLSFEWAKGNLLRTTIVLTADSLVSYVPDMMSGSAIDSLRDTGSRLAALESWIEEHFKREDTVAQLATVTSMETVPGGACGILEKVLEKHFKKDVIIDHGMDLVLDDYGGRREGDTGKQSAFLKPRKSKSQATSLAEALSADIDAALSHGAGSGISSSTESISAQCGGATCACGGSGVLQHTKGHSKHKSAFAGRIGEAATSSAVGADDTVEEFSARGNRSFAELVLHIVATDRQKSTVRRVRKVYPSLGEDKFSFDDFKSAFDFLTGKVKIFGKTNAEERVGLLSAEEDDEMCVMLINNPYVDTNASSSSPVVGSLFRSDVDLGIGRTAPRMCTVPTSNFSSYRLLRDDGIDTGGPSYVNSPVDMHCGDYNSTQPSAPTFCKDPTFTDAQGYGGRENLGFVEDSPPPLYKSPSPGHYMMCAEPARDARGHTGGRFCNRSPDGTALSPLQMESIDEVFPRHRKKTYSSCKNDGASGFDSGIAYKSHWDEPCSSHVATHGFGVLGGFRPLYGDSPSAQLYNTPTVYQDRVMTPIRCGAMGHTTTLLPSSRVVSPQCAAVADEFCRMRPINEDEPACVLGAAGLSSSPCGVGSSTGSRRMVSRGDTTTRFNRATSPDELTCHATVRSPSSRIVSPQCAAVVADFCRTQSPDESRVIHVSGGIAGFRSPYGGSASGRSDGSYVHFDGIRTQTPIDYRCVEGVMAANDPQHLSARVVYRGPRTDLSSISSNEVDCRVVSRPML